MSHNALEKAYCRANQLARSKFPSLPVINEANVLECIGQVDSLQFSNALRCLRMSKPKQANARLDLVERAQ